MRLVFKHSTPAEEIGSEIRLRDELRHPHGIAVYSVWVCSGCNNGKTLTDGSVPLPIRPVPKLDRHPSQGRYLYAANVGSFDISAYTIDGTSGALTPVAGSPFSTGDNPQGVIVHNSGKFLYVASNTGTSSTISGFSIEANSGRLTAIVGSPFPGGQVLSSLAQDRSGAYLYVADIQAGTVLGYAVDQSSGALTPVPGSPFPRVRFRPLSSAIRKATLFS